VRQCAVDERLDGEVRVWRAGLHALQEGVATLRGVDARGVEAGLEEEAVGVGGDDEVVLWYGLYELEQILIDGGGAPIEDGVRVQEAEGAGGVGLREMRSA
jgi:hypothetical protein